MAMLKKVGLIFLIVICSVSATKKPPPCHTKCPKPNQVYTTNGNHPCQNTCESPDFQISCSYSAGNYTGCICKNGYLKNRAGKCIKENLCRQCTDNPNNPNEIYSECNNHPCLNTCALPNNIASCTYPPGCYPGCVCIENFLRNDNGECVYKDDCPPPTPTPAPSTPSCPDGEEYSDCGTNCPPTCENKDDLTLSCASPVCVPGCFCRGGLVRNTQTGECVPPEECPAPVCADPNEKYYSCKPCRYTCENPSFACAAVCTPGCECKEGYIRQSNLDSTCVPKESCLCPSNEEFKACGTACPITCKNKDNPPIGCTKNCVLGCFCKKGYVRDEASGKCVLPKNCPVEPKPPKCNKNEVWLKKCAKFQDTCQTSYNPELGFKPGCCCKNGYVREFTGGKCIRREDCDYDEHWD